MDRVFASAPDTWFGDVEQLGKPSMFRKNNVISMYISISTALIRVRIIQVRKEVANAMLSGH